MLARVCTPSSPVTEREREKRERCRIFISLLLPMAELLFLFLKGMTRALTPFSYLVQNVER